MENAPRASWTTAPATRAVIEALIAEGADVRFVGGSVRDALLGRESTDIDIATPDEPERVLALLGRAGIPTRTVPRGIAHGTVTALAGGKRYEITTLRRDERTDGRHAEVAFTDDWQADAARRDFTINAMSAAPDGMLHDYFGGHEDLKDGRVRFVGDPATRIAEDHLRLLRFFRFHAGYGRGAPDAAALAACKAAATTLSTLSGERVRTESMKLLAAPDPLPAVGSMHDAGVLAVLLPEAQGIGRLAAMIAVERIVAEADPIRRLASLLPGAAGTKAVSARWCLSGTDGERLAALAAPPAEFRPDLDRRSQRRLIYRLGPSRFRDLVLLAWAAACDDESEARYRTMLGTAERWEAPTLPVRGADVLALGIEAGPDVGRLLAAVEAWWIERDFMPDRTAVLSELAARSRRD